MNFLFEGLGKHFNKIDKFLFINHDIFTVNNICSITTTIIVIIIIIILIILIIIIIIIIITIISPRHINTELASSGE